MPSPTMRDAHVDRVATRISIAYKNADYIYPGIAPVVAVDNQSGLYFSFTEDDWFRNRSGPRSPGTRAPRADYSLSTSPFLCINDALAKEIPDEVRNNADAPYRPDITGTNFVSDGLELALEIRVANLLTACANWANASNPGVLWDSDSSDFWGDIDNCVNAVVQRIGQEPNVCVMGWPVWRTIRNHPDAVDRVKYTRPSGRVEPGDLRSWFGFENVLIGKAIQNTAKPGQAASMSFVWGKHFWVGYVPPAPTIETPAAMYVFRWGNRVVERFRMDQEKTDVIAAEWFTDEVITASIAGAGMFTVTAS